MESASVVSVYKPSQVLSLLLSILWCVLTGRISASTSFSPSYLYTDLSWSSIHSHPQWGPGRGRKPPRRPHVSVRSAQREGVEGWGASSQSSESTWAWPRPSVCSHMASWSGSSKAWLNMTCCGWQSLLEQRHFCAGRAGRKPWKYSGFPHLNLHPSPGSCKQLHATCCYMLLSVATCCYSTSSLLLSPGRFYRCRFQSLLYKN